MVLALLWFGVSLPLVFFGAFLGYKKDPMTVPVQTNPIPRQIPPQVFLIFSDLHFSLRKIALVPATSIFHCNGRTSVLWSCICRDVLHYLVHLAGNGNF